MNNNQAPFELVNSRGKTRKNTNTQLNVINCLSTDLLNELLQRFRSQAIVREIQIRRATRPEVDKQIQIKSAVIPNSKKYKASLYINYTKSNAEVFHFSFHLCPNGTNRSSSGLIHVKQTTNSSDRIIPIRIKHGVNPESLIFTLGKSVQGKQNLTEQYKLEAQLICDVLTTYFDTGNTEKYIGIASSKRNKNLRGINKSVKQSLSKINSTRKS